MHSSPRTRSDSVTERLRERLLNREFPPHSRLQEVALAAQLQVSRTPIREALQALAKDGLLDYAPNRGYTVRHFSRTDILAAFRVRAVLEGLGCRLVAEQGLSESLAATLSQTIQQGERLLADWQNTAEWVDAWRRMNRQFHLAILLATDNDLLVRFAGVSRNIPVVFNGAFRWYSQDDFRRSLDHHRIILEALQRQQAERADFMMQEHVHHAADIIGRHYAEDGADNTA